MSFKKRRRFSRTLLIDVLVLAFLAVALLGALKYFGFEF